MNWDLITNIILITAIAILGIMALLGAYQWTTRGSIKKVDRHLLAMIPPLVMMLIIYIFFDKFLILATRPDGSGESSFPSTHVMAVATIFAMVAISLPRYIKSKNLRVTLDAVMAILTLLTAIGRIMAGKHWPTDVLGALIFAAAFACIYYWLLKKFSHRKEQNG
ncbi:phosphatase PAP2 family protein [Candidatus Saccharibacteria bacterium]|nr:phosphatase PAP2 family protein [Candidatus Saccharibacteria bacterium]